MAGGSIYVGFGAFLVSAYLRYKTAYIYVWCKKQKDLVSQYEFRKAIVLAWIGVAQENNSNDQREKITRRREEVSLQSDLTYSIAVSRERRNNTYAPARRAKVTRVNDTTLNPNTGTLKSRLDTSLRYLPNLNLNELKTWKLWCALQRYVDRKIEYKDTIMTCLDYNVILCLYFYWPFQYMKKVGPLKKIVKNVVEKFDHCSSNNYI